MNHDLMQSMRDGQPFYLMEQMSSATNWLSYNALKRLGGVGLLIWQAVAHGGDSVLSFQIYRSIGICEEYHGALMGHAGHEHIWVLRETRALGAQLAALLDAIPGAGTTVRAAIVANWDNWWALEYSAGSSYELKYLDEVERHHQPSFKLNIPVDIVPVEDDLKEYKMVVAKDQIISGVMHVIQNMYNPRLFAFIEI